MTKPHTRAPRFDLPDLRLFVAVIEAGSLSRGAARLPLALSAASARLKALEERAGVLLLKRRANGVVPTDAGKLFFDYARRVTQAARDAQAALDAMQSDGQLTITVLSNAMGISTGLPSHLGRFLQAHPRLDLRLEQLPTPEVVNAIAAGAADVGIIDAVHTSPDLFILPYRQDRIVVLVPKCHPLAARQSCSFAEVLVHPLVGMDPSSSLQKFNEQMALLARLPAHFRAQAPSFRDAAQLVAEKVGVAILPDAPARRYQQDLSLAIVELDETWAVRDLQVCVRRSIEETAPARQLATFLTEAWLPEADADERRSLSF